jgi:N-acylneuraminate cytidylyltransferase
MEVLAVIPARGGSKAIPRKNLLPFCGKPLIAWTILAARAAPSIDRVVVSTDDPEIGCVAREYGAEVVWRPDEISNDRSSSEAALLHALERLELSDGYRPDLLVFLQCTAPLTTSRDIENVVQTLVLEQADSALAVTDFHEFVWRQDGDNAVGVNHDKSHRPMRQELPPSYVECGSVFVMCVRGFRQYRHRFFGKTSMCVVPRERYCDINDHSDVALAEVMMRRRLMAEQESLIPPDLKAMVFDFDGVFTDNRVFVDQNGSEAVYCSRADGLGISRLRDLGLHLLVLSSETNSVVEARCRKLGLTVIDSTRKKWPILSDWLKERGISPHQAAYLGNDHNDLDCLREVGCAVAVSDAYPEVKSAADVILSARGGRGAVRELCELLLNRLGETRSVKSA